ncbi:amidohydrolase family protein [Shimia thalassica]|uniref:metal-dependent hydrolase family protein n=1 Tax=Shimia thalassica TaxID=1715693 RepID=UPI0026E2D875|nr:amidohydrolase family protein [Shimia thalassica]MDO6477994.1 amidohydrolase family protein [Shimia thalassica]MDO6522157.1 amidohydrolase family protein [Shimia thalassica]MDP2581377.1 amidohydrolase family protein [Shimia thalassica]
MKNSRFVAGAVASFLLTMVPHLGTAQEDAPRQVLFTNVNIFNGVDGELMENGSVLVEGNLIKTVSADAIDAPDAYMVDGEGRTLMPGLIDMHSHMCIRNGMLEFRDNYDQMANGAYTALVLQDYLDQGFTTARDAGCNILGIAKAVNNDIIPGPRLYPSGAFLSQTGGHADTGSFNDVPGDVDDLEAHMFGFIADGVPEVIRAARHNLRAGATQIKVMAGGGVASEFDPLHTTQYSPEELKAIVEVAKDYGTYVLVHAYHDRSVNRAIDAGVRVIDHNFLVSEETIIRMKEEGVALSVQAVMSLQAFGNPEAITFFSADQKNKAAQVNSGAQQMMEWAVKHDVLMVTGGDMFGPDVVRQADNIIWFNDKVANDPLLSLKTATSNAAEVLTWSGGMNPYKEGTLGTIVEGGYADIILVDGNPLEDINAIKRDTVDFVMKDGDVYKNWLPEEKAPAFKPAKPSRDAYFGNL